MRKVDHEERRRIIVEAVWKLLERGGIEAASVRGVVAETGLSSGSIRFFFSSQAGLHTVAMESLAGRVQHRIEQAAQEPDIAKRVMDMVSELMPLRDDTERELSVWMAFVARARHDEAMARIVSEQARQARNFLHHVVSSLVELEHLPSSTDIEAETLRLSAIVDGLTFQLLTTPEEITREQARTVLRAVLLPNHH